MTPIMALIIELEAALDAGDRPQFLRARAALATRIGAAAALAVGRAMDAERRAGVALPAPAPVAAA
jgi:hypothetical protein